MRCLAVDVTVDAGVRSSVTIGIQWHAPPRR